MRKRILATIAVFAMVVSMLPTIVMADGSKEKVVTLDVSDGVIDIYPEGYSQTDVEYGDIYDEYGDWMDFGWYVKEALTPGNAAADYYEDEDNGKTHPTEWKAFKGTYIITGNSGYTDSEDPTEIDDEAYNSGKDTVLDIINFSGKPVEYNLVFEDLKVRSYDWSTAIRFKGNAAITVNIINKGDTVIEGHNHPAFKINDNDMNSNNVYVNIYNTLGSALSFADRFGEESEEEIWDDELGEYSYVTIKRPQIYGSDQTERGIIVFKINNEVVNNGNNGGTIDNKGEAFDSTHDGHNYENTSQAGVNAFWSHDESLKMTVSEFEDNTDGIICTFKCTECNDTKDVVPAVAEIDDGNKTGTYIATLIDETTNKELASSTKTYDLIDVAAGGNAGSDKIADESPFTGDSVNIILLISFLLVSGAAIIAVTGKRRFDR